MATCVLIRDTRFPVGGFETWVETLAEGLPRKGVDTVLLVPDAGASRAYPASEVIRIPSASDAESQAGSIVRALGDLARRGRSGVFFTMGYPYINIAGLNLRNSPWCAVPVVHGRHASAFPWLVAGPPKKIVVPSKDYAEVVRNEVRRRARWFRALGRVVHIPHGVRLPPEAAVKSSLPMPVCARVLALTRFDNDMKRPLDIIKVALHARELGIKARFIVGGSGPAEPEMRALAGDVVEFAGVIPRSDVSRFLLSGDVFLSTSESEAFGLSVAEALACGCAVVAADAGGALRELVTPATGRMAPPGDIPGLVAALREVLPAARSMGDAGQRLIADRFDEEAMLDRYASLIRSLCKRTVRPNPDWIASEPLLTTPEQLTLPSVGDRLRGIFR